MKKARTYKTGFTLLELVVIVFIIVLLALVILPMVTKYIQSGKNTDAMASAKVLNISLQAALVQNIEMVHFEEDAVRSLEGHQLLSEPEFEDFYRSLGDYLPADFAGAFSYSIEDGMVSHLLWQNEELSCFYDSETGEYIITMFDDGEVLDFNSGQEFEIFGIEEDELP